MNGKFFRAQGINYSGLLQSKNAKKISEKLQPIFEAFTNSLEAIKTKKSDEKNQIVITLNFDSSATLTGEKNYELSSITIEDSGIGFDDTEFNRFKEIFNQDKKYNNQGTGRIQFLHFFDMTEFESVYKQENSFYKRTFSLSKSNNYLLNNSVIFYSDPTEASDIAKTYTKLKFKKLLDEGDKKYYNNLDLELLKSEIIDHYLYEFCEYRDQLPKIILKRSIDNKEEGSLEITSKDIPKEDKKDEVKIEYKKFSGGDFTESEKSEIFKIKCFKIDKDKLKANSIKLTSKQEIVTGDIEKKIFINVLRADDTIEKKRYLFLVSSNYIDKRDNDQRGQIDIPSEEEIKNNTNLFSDEEVISSDDINKKINNFVLKNYEEIRKKNDEYNLEIEDLKNLFLLDSNTIKNIELNIQDNEEKILRKIYKYDAELKAKNDAKIKMEADEIKDLDPRDANYENDLNDKVEKLVRQIPLRDRTALATYVARRKLVLKLLTDVINSGNQVKSTNKQNNKKIKINENFLHNIFFEKLSNNPDKSDLWIINEEFIYFEGTSNRNLGSIELNGKPIFKQPLTQEEEAYKLKQSGNASLKKPDILLFPSEGKCIIIEFKSPEVDASDHLNQISKYASLINNLSDEQFNFKTFYGYLIGENIDPDSVTDADSGFENASNFDYLFRPSKKVIGKFGRKDGSIYTEVIKYSTLLARAKKRNEIFIKKLGIDS